MKPSFNEKLVAYLALISGLSISAVAVYYSVVGLAAIFAAAFIPIVIMGIALEVSKLVATIWLKQNWEIAPKPIKIYLMSAIAVLMFITSMGIFGFLSKAHLDQTVPTGDIAAKVALIDERIKVQRENLAIAKSSLDQLNSQVNARLNRSEDERGAERAVQIRRQQASERNALQKEITQTQAEISKLNNEKAPLAAELRKVEVEVGPIKYIANFFYGTSDQTVLEKAVVWVIIILIFVFDPLAVILLIVSQISFQRFREFKEETIQPTIEKPTPIITEEEKEAILTTFSDHHTPETHPYLNQGFKYPEGHEFVKPLVAKQDLIFPVVETIVTPPIEPVVTETIGKIETPNVPNAFGSLPGVRYKVFKRPEIQSTVETTMEDHSPEKESDIVSTATVDEPLFIQNEEQNESNLWTTSTRAALAEMRAEILSNIQPEDYATISKEKTEEKINEYVELVRSNKILMEDVPKEILLEVRSRV